MKSWKTLAIQTLKNWKQNRPLSEGAALSFYILITLPALILSVLFLTGIFLERETLQIQVLHQIELILGDRTKLFVEQILRNVPPPSELRFASVVTLGVFLLGAIAFFGNLQRSLDHIWNITPKKDSGWKYFFANKLRLALMVVGLGGIFLATMMTELILSFLLPYFQSFLAFSISLLQVSGYILAFFITTLAFAFLYQYLPHVKIRSKDAWIGAIATSILFTIGKFLIGIYLSYSPVGSAYGAAGSLVAFVVWVYYSSQVIFLGAEFTQAYANLYGSKIRPSKQALKTDSWWNHFLKRV